MATSESLMFDGNRMQEEQEEELKQDEDERQQQLKDLLSHAFDDLVPSDSCSNASDDSHDSGRHSDEVGQQNQWNNNGRPPYHASTPISEAKAPPLVTPMIRRSYSSPASSTSASRYPPNGYQDNQAQHPHRSHSQQYKQEVDELYQETEAESLDHTEYGGISQHPDNEDMAHQTHPYYIHQGAEPQYSNYTSADVTHRSQSSSANSEHSQQHHNPQHQQLYALLPHNQYCQYRPSSQHGTPHQQQVYQHNHQYSRQYSAGSPSQQHQLQMCSPSSAAGMSHEQLEKTVYVDQDDAVRVSSRISNNNHSNNNTGNLQEQFFSEGPSSSKAQIEILYQAKSGQLQELQEKYELLKLESSKEIRILRHEAALLEGAKQGTEASLKQTQSLLTQSKDARFDLQKRLDQIESQYNVLETERNELKQQLNSAEASIESLNQQIFALGSTDSIERLREQHESIISSLKQQHSDEIRRLHEQLTHIQYTLDEQTRDVDASRLKLKAEVEEISKERLDHAETVNRLTKSLKESQCQTQELLSQTSGEEMSKLKIQLQQANASKRVTENLCNSLQQEISDLKEQISIYESSSHLLAPSTGSINMKENIDDSMAELGIKPLKQVNRLSKISSVSEDETTLILRRELQKCLVLLKEKRAELSALRNDYNSKLDAWQHTEDKLESLKVQLNNSQLQLKESVIELNLYKSAATEGSSLSEVKLRTQVETLQKDKTLLEDSIKTLNERIAGIAASEANLQEINAELNTKMAEMVEDFDNDKKTALERCQQTLESHNQTVREMMRSELQAQYDINLSKAENQYTSEISKLRGSVGSLTEELSHVKELYVQVCEEKTQMEEHEKITLNAHSEELQNLMTEMDSMKSVWSAQEAGLQQQMKNLEAEKTTLKSEQASLQDKIHSLEEQLEATKMKAETSSGYDSTSKPHEQLSDLSSTLSVCKELFKDDLTRSSNQSLTSRSSAHSSLTDNKTIQIQTLREQLLNEQKSLGTTKTELNRLKSELKTVKSELEVLQTEVTEKEKLLTEKGSEVIALNGEVKQLNTVITGLQSDTQRLDSLLSAERAQLGISKSTVTSLEEQLEEERSRSRSCAKITDEIESISQTLAKSKETIARLETELAAEKTKHQKTRDEYEKLESGLNAERTSQSLAIHSLSSLEQDLQGEKTLTKQLKDEISQLEQELEAERKLHGNTKIEMVKLETRLSTEQDSQEELRKQLEKRKMSGGKLEVELEVVKASEKRNNGLIADLKNQQHQDRQQLEGLKASHKQVLSELNYCKAEMLRKSSEISQLKSANSRMQLELDSISATNEQEKATLRLEHMNTLEKALDDARQRWANESGSIEMNEISSENQSLKQKVAEMESEVRRYEKLLADADSHLESQVTKLRHQIESDYQEKITSMELKMNEQRQQHEETKKQGMMKVHELNSKIQDYESKCRSYQHCTDELRQNLESLTTQTTALKSTNKRLQAELNKANSTYENKIDNLSTRLQQKSDEFGRVEHEHSLTVQSLKQKMIAMRNEHDLEMEKLKTTQVTITPRPVDDSMRQHYEATLQKMKNEVLKYVEETNKSAAKHIKTEVQKAKLTTARQMRDYYLKCFKKTLRDNQSTEEDKIKHLERTLDRAMTSLTPTNINADSILSIPDHFLPENDTMMSSRPHSRAAAAPQKPRTIDDKCSAVSITDPVYKYESLRTVNKVPTLPNNGAVGRPPTNPIRTTSHSASSGETVDIIRQLGLNSTQTSPPRWYNPPPEKLEPSPRRSGPHTAS